MGAKIEIDIFLKRTTFSLQQIISLIENEGISVKIREIIIFDDWEYKNQKMVDLRYFDWNENQIFTEHFTLISFTVINVCRGTLITSIIDDVYMELSFALDIDDLFQTAGDALDTYEDALYERIVDIINHKSDEKGCRDRFVAASMGIEYFVQFEGNITETISKANGDVKWVLPSRAGRDFTLKGFLREEKRNVVVLTRIDRRKSHDFVQRTS